MDYKARHYAAMDATRIVSPLKNPHETAMVALVKAWRLYADAHASAYGSTLTDDHVLGRHWVEIGRGIVGLLNGQTGRLDCGTIDAEIRNACGEEEV